MESIAQSTRMILLPRTKYHKHTTRILRIVCRRPFPIESDIPVVLTLKQRKNVKVDFKQASDLLTSLVRDKHLPGRTTGTP